MEKWKEERFPLFHRHYDEWIRVSGIVK
jgi:hypothetical protein